MAWVRAEELEAFPRSSGNPPRVEKGSQYSYATMGRIKNSRWRRPWVDIIRKREGRPRENGWVDFQKLATAGSEEGESDIKKGIELIATRSCRPDEAGRRRQTAEECDRVREDRAKRSVALKDRVKDDERWDRSSAHFVATTPLRGRRRVGR